MPRSNKKRRHLKAAHARKKQKHEESKQTLEKPLTKRVRNIGLDSDDDEEAVYTEMLLDEFGTAMQDVFDIFHKEMSGDGGEDNRTVISKAVIEPNQSKKPSNRLDESLRTKQRRFFLIRHYTTIVTDLLLRNNLSQWSLSLINSMHRNKAAIEGYMSNHKNTIGAAFARQHQENPPPPPTFDEQERWQRYFELTTMPPCEMVKLDPLIAARTMALSAGMFVCSG